MTSLVDVMVDTKIDLLYAMNVVSEYMLELRPTDCGIVNGIMRYLNGSFNFKSCLGGSYIVIHGHYDAK